MKSFVPLAALLLLACEPSRTPPVRVMAMVINQQGQYEPSEVTLNTVTDIVGLKGKAVTIVGGARIVADPNNPLLAGLSTDDAYATAWLKSPGTRPTASYVDKDGVLWPADFHTWNMVSTYYNFERAYTYFLDNLVTEAEMRDPNTAADGPKAYYFASFTLTEVSDQPLLDNALFYSLIKAFVVLPFQDLQTVPLSMNSGIVAHEFSHRVFNTRVYGGSALPLPFSRWITEITASTPVNVLKSIDEGLADFHAFGASCASTYGCNTRFLEASLGAQAADNRDFNKPGRCVDSTLRNAVNTLNLGTFTSQGLEYKLGTIFASALYKSSYPSKRQTMERAVLASYSDQDATKPGLFQLVTGNADTPDNFTLAAVCRTILQHITDPQLKVDTCNNFMDMLQLSKADLTSSGGQVACPAASSNPGTCPALP